MIELEPPRRHRGADAGARQGQRARHRIAARRSPRNSRRCAMPDAAVVLTGQGRMFSAGVDLLRLGEGGAAYVRRFLPALHRLYDAVFFFPKPVVAAVNGHAIAGGCVLACCADRRIAARDGLPHRRDRAAGRRAVSGDGVRGHALCHAAGVLRRDDLERRDLSAGRGAGAPGWSTNWSSPLSCIDRAIAAAETLAALSPRPSRDQAAASPAGADALASRAAHRHGRERDLGGARDARAHPRLRRAHLQRVELALKAPRVSRMRCSVERSGTVHR